MGSKKLEAAMPQPSDEQEPQDYEVQDAANTLMRAEEIKRNKKLMPHVHKHLNKQMKSLKDLKRLAVEKDMGQKDDDGDYDGGN